jgi:hypothetical protein
LENIALEVTQGSVQKPEDFHESICMKKKNHQNLWFSAESLIRQEYGIRGPEGSLRGMQKENICLLSFPSSFPLPSSLPSFFCVPVFLLLPVHPFFSNLAKEADDDKHVLLLMP